MFKIVVFLAVFIAACHADTTPKPVYCGEMPKKVLTCLNPPRILTSQVTSKCISDAATECEAITCAFRENGWLQKDGTVDKVKVAAYLNQLAKDKPEWKSVIETVVPSCVERQLPPQGVHVNCPAYDVMHCAMLYFIKKAPESQWSSSQECTYPRQYAGSCAVCPSDCFASQVPYGSCNACYLARL